MESGFVSAVLALFLIALRMILSALGGLFGEGVEGVPLGVPAIARPSATKRKRPELRAALLDKHVIGPLAAQLQSKKMTVEKIEFLREKTRRLCAERKLKILPYGPAWWIFGQGVSRVFSDLAGVVPSDLRPLPIYER